MCANLDASDPPGVEDGLSSVVRGPHDEPDAPKDATDVQVVGMPQRRCLVISLIRHAESQGNVGGAVLEDDDQDPLTEQGRVQAEALGQAWKDTRIDHLFSSPYIRAHETANALSTHNKDHPEVNINHLLIERKRGRKVPRLLRQKKRKEADEELTGEPWYTYPLACPFHRPAEGGESVLDLIERAATVLTTILQPLGVKLSEPPEFFVEEETTDDPAMLPAGIPHVVIVSHGLFLYHLYNKLCAEMKYYGEPNCHYGNTSWSRHILWYDEDLKESPGMSDMKICTD